MICFRGCIVMCCHDTALLFAIPDVNMSDGNRPSVAEAVSQITVKALRQYRSRHKEEDPADSGENTSPQHAEAAAGDADVEDATSPTESGHRRVVDEDTVHLTTHPVTFDALEDRNEEETDPGISLDSDEDLEGENELYVLPSDHVRGIVVK